MSLLESLLSSKEQISAVDRLKAYAANNQIHLTEISRNDDWVAYSFAYQNGKFICHASTNMEDLLLQLPCIAEVPYTPGNYVRVMSVCHNHTRNNCYTKVINNYTEEDNKLSINVLQESIGPSENAFLYYLGQCFQVAEEVRNALDKGGLEDERLFQVMRDNYMLTQAELAHEANVFLQENSTAVSPKQGTLLEYITYLFDGEDPDDLLSLVVLSHGGVEEITQKERIASYDLLGSMIVGEGEEARFASPNPVVLTLDATANHYVFTLHPLESGKEFLSVRMTAVCTPHEYLQDYVPDATYTPRAVSLKLCHVKTNRPENEPKSTGELPQTSNSKQLLHGHQLMQRGCYLQAIAVITPIFQRLKHTFYTLSENNRSLFFQACYDLGFCYCDLRQHEKAFYFLDLAETQKRFDYSQEYINCLAEGHDIRIFNVLDKECSEITRLINEIDNDDERGTEDMMERRERLTDYYAFLQRRRGYSQINFGFLDEAEKTFLQLLGHEGSRDYAAQELEYIKQLRNENQ